METMVDEKWVVVVRYPGLAFNYDEELGALAEKCKGRFDGTDAGMGSRGVFLYFVRKADARAFVRQAKQLPATQEHGASFDLHPARTD